MEKKVSNQKTEIIVKKMEDYRNHRRFMLRCIKASITPVSCKLKNPLKSKKSYHIIHKVEKQLLCECIRNINNTLETLDKQRETQYKKFKDMLANQHDQDSDLDRCRLLINKIKDHRHSKIKEKHIDRFERLYFKCYGHLNNINRQAENINNIKCQNTLSGHQKVPSSITTTSTTASNPSTVPATPMAPTSSNSTADSNPTPRLPSFSLNHTCTDKWVINLSKPPLPRNNYSYSKKDQTMPSPPNTPHRSIHNSHWTSILQTTSTGSGWVQIRGQKNS